VNTLAYGMRLHVHAQKIMQIPECTKQNFGKLFVPYSLQVKVFHAHYTYSMLSGAFRFSRFNHAYSLQTHGEGILLAY